MKSLKELYANSLFITYNDIIDSFEYDVLHQVDDNDYQGDTRVLFKDAFKYGYLNFGWGSCSVCDALQACNTLEEIEQLQERLYNSIQWFSNKEETLKWFKGRDWETTYEWHIEETKRFVSEVIDMLSVEENNA